MEHTTLPHVDAIVWDADVLHWSSQNRSRIAIAVYITMYCMYISFDGNHSSNIVANDEKKGVYIFVAY